MKRGIIIFILPIIFIGLSAVVFAQETELPDPGLTPDSPFYFFKTWKEQIQLFFTFGEENKAKQYLHLSEVRLAEYQKMIEKGKTEIAQKTLDKYEQQLNQAVEKAQEVQKNEGLEEAIDAIQERRMKHQEVLTKVLATVPRETKQEITEKRSEKWMEFITEVQKSFPEMIPGPVEIKNIPIQVILGCPIPSVPLAEDCEGGWLLNQAKACPYFSCPGASKRQTQEPPKPAESEKLIEKPLVEKSIESPVCVQVITPALSPLGVCKEFPTPCDVPSNWKKVDKCPVSAMAPASSVTSVPTPKSVLTSAPAEVRYYTCPDGTKVVSGECFGEGERLACSIATRPEIKCPQITTPVIRGAVCSTVNEVKYYQCEDGTQIPWCMCFVSGGEWADPPTNTESVNRWQCQYYSVGFTCPKPTVTSTPRPTPAPAPAPTTQPASGIACCVQGEVCKVFSAEGEEYNKSLEQCRSEGRLTGSSNCSPNPCQPFSAPTAVTTATSDDVACQKGPMANYKCPDGTLLKWQCSCKLQSDGEESRSCTVNPAASCPASAAPLAINWIRTRYNLWKDTKESGGAIRMAIFWATNKPTNSWIEYGLTTAYGSTQTSPKDFSPNYNHNVLGISGLQHNTTYYFRIIDEDTAGNKIISDDYTFTTGL